MKSWCYEFSCDKSLYELETILNETSPWPWIVRDCAWYPDFLQASPHKNVRICIYRPSSQPTYRSLVEIGESSKLERSSLDPFLLDLLKRLSTEILTEIEPEEWPFD